MVEKSEIVGCLILPEFVDDASSGSEKARPCADDQDAHAIKSLVDGIACEMHVPRLNLEQRVERGLSVAEPTIEDHVRAALEKTVESQQQSYNDSFVS